MRFRRVRLAHRSYVDPFFLLLSPRPRYSSSFFVFPSYLPPSSLPSNSSTSSSSTSYLSHHIVPVPATVPVTLRAVLTMSQTSPSYSPHPTRYHPRRVLLALIVTTFYSLSSSPPAPSLTSYSLLCILQLPGVCHSESCANHVTKLAIILAASYLLSFSPRLTHSHSRHVLLAIVLTTGILIAILLIVVVLIASCRICQLSFVSDT